ncbi:MAG: hypothetical protein JWM12_888 [Ilumatobacteraceae bacterium]|nr:hypothetical protein [Ilumatobacteraceae bacterium]
MTRTSRLAGTGVVFVALVALAACGSDKATTTTTTSVVTSAAPSTTSAPSTSAAVDTSPATTPAEQLPTTTVAAVPVMPLTGKPITDPAAAARQAIVVKVDNHPDARPQSGLGVADLVYEENVEQLTRFAAVFQTTVPDPVGPVRSGRTQDVLLLGSLNKPMFAWSGGNARVTAAIEGSDFFVVRVDANQFSKAAGTYRAKGRAAPHNLYTTGSGLLSLSPAGSEPPPQQFQYLAAGATAPGDPSAGVQLAMDGVNVKWTYDAASNGYLRFQDGQPHKDQEHGQINAANVVVLTVDYQPSPADGRSPEAQTIGSGAVDVYTGGKIVSGTWTRADRLAPFTLTDASGKPILLTPGSTWVELARGGSATPLAS